jgi:D-sedoheptulose 7-phosphate isomerase
MEHQLREYFLDINKALCSLIVTDREGKEVDPEEGMRKWINRIREMRDVSGCMFLCGNGASATMAEHFSHDFFQNAKTRTDTCSETSHITAISNDIGYEKVFAYRIERLISEKDLLVTISSSGNSPNIIEAIKAAKEKGAFVVTLSGKKKENLSRQMGDLNFYVPLNTYGMVESAHAVLLHGALDLFLDEMEGGRH